MRGGPQNFLLLVFLVHPCWYSLIRAQPPFWISEVYNSFTNFSDAFVEIYDGGRGNVSLSDISLELEKQNHETLTISLNDRRTNIDGFLVLSLDDADEKEKGFLQTIQNETIVLKLTKPGTSNDTEVIDDFNKERGSSDMISCFRNETKINSLVLVSGNPSKGQVNDCPLSPVRLDLLICRSPFNLTLQLVSHGINHFPLTNHLIRFFEDDTLIETFPIKHYATYDKEVNISIPIDRTFNKTSTYTINLGLQIAKDQIESLENLYFGAQPIADIHLNKTMTYPDKYPAQLVTPDYLQLVPSDKTNFASCYCEVSASTVKRFVKVSSSAMREENCEKECIKILEINPDADEINQSPKDPVLARAKTTPPATSSKTTPPATSSKGTPPAITSKTTPSTPSISGGIIPSTNDTETTPSVNQTGITSSTTSKNTTVSITSKTSPSTPSNSSRILPSTNDTESTPSVNQTGITSSTTSKNTTVSMPIYQTATTQDPNKTEDLLPTNGDSLAPTSTEGTTTHPIYAVATDSNETTDSNSTTLLNKNLTTIGNTTPLPATTMIPTTGKTNSALVTKYSTEHTETTETPSTEKNDSTPVFNYTSYPTGTTEVSATNGTNSTSVSKSPVMTTPTVAKTTTMPIPSLYINEIKVGLQSNADHWIELKGDTPFSKVTSWVLVLSAKYRNTTFSLKNLNTTNKEKLLLINSKTPGAEMLIKHLNSNVGLLRLYTSTDIHNSTHCVAYQTEPYVLKPEWVKLCPHNHKQITPREISQNWTIGRCSSDKFYVLEQSPNQKNKCPSVGFTKPVYMTILNKRKIENFQKYFLTNLVKKLSAEEGCMLSTAFFLNFKATNGRHHINIAAFLAAPDQTKLNALYMCFKSLFRKMPITLQIGSEKVDVYRCYNSSFLIPKSPVVTAASKTASGKQTIAFVIALVVVFVGIVGGFLIYMRYKRKSILGMLGMARYDADQDDLLVNMEDVGRLDTNFRNPTYSQLSAY